MGYKPRKKSVNPHYVLMKRIKREQNGTVVGTEFAWVRSILVEKKKSTYGFSLATDIERAEYLATHPNE